MKVNITARHMELTDGLREHIESKLKQRIAKVAFHEIEANVTLEVHKHGQSAEICLTSEKHFFSSKEETSDMYTAIDHVVDKLERQLHKYKEKVTSHKGKKERGFGEEAVLGSEEVASA